MDAFDGKIIMVSGGASGIGRRAAQRFAAVGATVIAGDLKVHEEQRSSTKDAGQIISRRLDVTVETEWRESIDWCISAFGRLDVLVNCAGIVFMRSVVDTELSDFQRIMSVNVEGTFLGMKYAMREMLKAGSGSIVNLSSSAGLVGSAGAGAYCASKGAVRLLTKSAALDALAAGTRVRVNSVHPSLVDTPMADEILRQLGGGDELRARLRDLNPSKRLATTDDVVDAIMFLASERASYINGSELALDNGYTAQ